MVKVPDAFDAWRLMQYFESMGIGTAKYADVPYKVATERQVEELLEKLNKDGHLVSLGDNKLYKLVMLSTPPPA
jgi:hypothetical protein